MSQTNQKCKCDLKYEILSAIDINVFPQIKLIFIFTKFGAKDVIFVTNSGDVFGYETNYYGRLGLGYSREVLKPSLIPELCGKDVIRVEFGEQFMVALTESMEVYTTNSTNYKKGSSQFQLIEIGDKLVADVKCCATSAFLLTDTKEVYRIDYGSHISASLILNSKNNVEIIAISCGSGHLLALTHTGNVYYLVGHEFGQWGTPDSQLIQMPENVFVKQISCGDNHSLLLTTDGQIYSFGDNSCGQLGTDDNISQMAPKLVKFNNKFSKIYAFENTSMALRAKNEVVIWGQLRDGKRFSPTETTEHSFQEAVNKYSVKVFTYKPLSGSDAFHRKPVNRMIRVMTKAFNDQTFGDLKFKLKHKGSETFDYIYCHKWFVVKISDYFERMFANDWAESETKEIEINSYSYEAYYQYIRCLYTNSIETEDTELLIELLSLTDEYLDDETKSVCVLKIKPLVNNENVYSFYSSSFKSRSKELEEFCFAFMSKNIDFVIQSKDYE